MTPLLDRPAPPTGASRPASRPSAGRRSSVRVPEAVLGLVLVLGGALGALLWHRSATATTLVTTLAADLTRGDELSASSLAPVEVASAGTLGLVPWSSADSLVGRRVVTDLPAGTPLLPGLVVDAVPLAQGEAMAGLKVAAGAYPADLAPGDVVDAVAVPAALATAETPSAPVVVASGATVHSVASLGDAELSLVVTLRLPTDAARALSAVAGPVRLVRVAG